MKIFIKNIVFLLLIITSLFITSCTKLSKSYCEEILDFSYTNNDSLIEYNISEAKKCSEKYHKRPEFLQKISQIYYYDAINDYTSEESSTVSHQRSARKLYRALENMNSYFNKAEELKSYDYQFRGDIYERLGDIYKDINSLKPAAELYDKALSDYEASNDNEKILNTLIKIGKLYQYNHLPEIAMIYFEMAEERENIPNNIYRKIIDNKIVTLYEINDYKQADSIFNNHFNIKIQDYDFHSAIGTKYFYERNYTQALPHLKYCFENGNQQERLAFSEKLAETYFNLNDHENEMLYIQHQAKNNSIEIRKTPLKLDLEKLFDASHKIINKENLDKGKNNPSVIIAIILTISIFTLIIIISLFVKSSKDYKEKIRSAEETISGNNDIIQSKDKIINDISKKLVSLEPNETYEEAYNRFCESIIYVKIKSYFEGVNILIKNVQNYSKFTLNNKDIHLLVKTFNSCFPKAIPSIKKDFEVITTSDIKFIILNFMNMNNVEIAVLLGLTYGAANKRNNKIKNIFNIKENLNAFLTDYVKSNF